MRIEPVERVAAAREAGPPKIDAVDIRAERLDADDRANVVARVLDVPDDDFRVLVVRDNRGGMGRPMVQGTEPVEKRAVVLLEHGAVGRIRRDRDPRAVLGERVLGANEARRRDRAVGGRRDSGQHRDCE